MVTTFQNLNIQVLWFQKCDLICKQIWNLLFPQAPIKVIKYTMEGIALCKDPNHDEFMWFFDELWFWFQLELHNLYFVYSL
jgi:hypothetical protein